MKKLLASRVEAAYVLLRIASGLMFSFHGMQKIFGVLTTHHTAVGTQIWFGGIIELTTGLAIAAGAFTTWAALLASGTMAVAYVLLFFYIACRGSGRWSIDRR